MSFLKAGYGERAVNELNGAVVCGCKITVELDDKGTYVLIIERERKMVFMCKICNTYLIILIVLLLGPNNIR